MGSKAERGIWQFSMDTRNGPSARDIDDLLRALADAIAPPVRPAFVCHLSRELVMAVAMSRSTVAWTGKKVEKAQELLQGSAEVTKGTPYERNCSGRSRDFKEALLRLRALENAWAPIRAQGA